MNNLKIQALGRLAALSFISAVAAFLGCSSPLPISSGSSSETVIGKVVSEGGKPAPATIVTLYPENYNPAAGALQASISFDTTNNQGEFSLTVPDAALRYTIVAVQNTARTRALIAGIAISADTTSIANAVLRVPGTISVMTPANADVQNGYFFIPGTGIKTDLAGKSGTIVLDSVPAGTIPEVRYSVKNVNAEQTVRFNIQVFSGDTARIFHPYWRYSRPLYFNTTSSGAGVGAAVTDFPVLVRLTKGVFDFSGAQAAGGDVRFTKKDGTEVSFELERWDASGGAAEMWVRVDTIFGNDSAQSIVMYWGNPAAASASGVAAVFDVAVGFQGVWHMADAGSDSAHDATTNGFNAAPFGMTAASAVPGMIGAAREFDGKTSFFTVSGSASGALNFGENGPFTLSAWVFADSLDNGFHEIISKGDLAYGMELHNINKWEITDFLDATGWQTVRSPATAQTWKYIVGVRDGAKEYLYVDGALAGDSIALRDSTGRSAAFDVCIGRQADAATRYWSGAIDEVNMANVARSAEWIKLSYMNQKAVNRLVEFR
jgi:hypothetical protein